MVTKQKREQVSLDGVDDARAHLEKLREQQWEVVQAAEARLAQLDAALSSLRLPDGMIVRSADYAGMGIIEAARDLMQRKGDGLTTRQLADGLRSNGLSTTSSRFIATLFATLRNAPKKFKRKDKRWYLVKGE